MVGKRARSSFCGRLGMRFGALAIVESVQWGGAVGGTGQ